MCVVVCWCLHYACILFSLNMYTPYITQCELDVSSILVYVRVYNLVHYIFACDVMQLEVHINTQYWQRRNKKTFMSLLHMSKIIFIWTSGRIASQTKILWTRPIRCNVLAAISHVVAWLTCDGQIMFNIDKAHLILDEMIANGQITETNKNRVLAPVAVLDKASKWQSTQYVHSYQ